MQLKRAGYYEKKLTKLEKELEGLKEQKQVFEYQQNGIQKILIQPLELHRLIQAEERKNQEILK